MAKKAKKDRDDTNGAERVPAKLNVVIPEGYKKQSTDILGFWDPDIVAGQITAIHFTPLEVKLFDSRIEKHKPSAIIVGRLEDPIPMSAPGGEDEVVECARGAIVGVWYKPGMSAIKQLGGVKVLLYPTGEIDTGKPNPMKTYDVLSLRKGAELQVTQDGRKESRGVSTTFTGGLSRGDAKANAQNPPEQGADDIPF